MSIIDISPLITEQIAVWPGDTPLRRHVLCDISAGSNIDLSSINSTVHIGAHADAPRHYNRHGVTIDAVPLEPYVGPCYVHSVETKPLILPSDCKTPIAMGVKRVLFKTDSFPNPNIFNRNFSAFSPESIEALALAGVVLIGIDTPSVDPFESKDLPAHGKLYEWNISNLEGLVLSHVKDGIYELIALPLSLSGFDASPVRAILRRP
jgi:arylformamidase